MGTSRLGVCSPVGTCVPTTRDFGCWKRLCTFGFGLLIDLLGVRGLLRPGAMCSVAYDSGGQALSCAASEAFSTPAEGAMYS